MFVTSKMSFEEIAKQCVNMSLLEAGPKTSRGVEEGGYGEDGVEFGG